MQTVYLLAVLVAVAMASPVPDTKVIPILSRSDKVETSGAFSLSYKTGDGIDLRESGSLKPTLDGKDMVLVKEGEISYTAPDGTPINLKYVADELGFRPVGAHLPVPVVALPISFV